MSFFFYSLIWCNYHTLIRKTLSIDMKIYTTYYAVLKKLPEDVVPISIAGRKPEGVDIIEYKKLSPSWSILSELKYKGGTIENYIERFRKEILGKLNKEEVLKELEELSGGRDIALCCYEKPGDFCHRYLVEEWLKG